MLAEGGTRFSVDSKWIIFGTRCRKVMGQLFARRYDPFGPFWGARPAEKYVHTCRHTIEKNRQKITIFGNDWSQSILKARWLYEAQNGVKRVLLSLNHLL